MLSSCSSSALAPGGSTSRAVICPSARPRTASGKRHSASVQSSAGATPAPASTLRGRSAGGAPPPPGAPPPTPTASASRAGPRRARGRGRKGGERLDDRYDLVAVDRRQVHVEEDQRRLLANGRLDAGQPILGVDDRVALRLEDGADQHPVFRIVLHVKDLRSTAVLAHG